MYYIQGVLMNNREKIRSDDRGCNDTNHFRCVTLRLINEKMAELFQSWKSRVCKLDYKKMFESRRDSVSHIYHIETPVSCLSTVATSLSLRRLLIETKLDNVQGTNYIFVEHADMHLVFTERSEEILYVESWTHIQLEVSQQTASKFQLWKVVVVQLFFHFSRHTMKNVYFFVPYRLAYFSPIVR